MLQTLNKNLQHQICAENSINSYNSCVLKLIRNSLDAKASVFHLDLDPSNFYIKIKDNGIGISLKNLAKVGERYYTTNEILKNVNRGETLANISSLASILQIKTREKSNPLTYIKIYCQGIHVFRRMPLDAFPIRSGARYYNVFKTVIILGNHNNY
ncbi:unnamed protein product [Gordionus sp. m RMFG-2023]